MDPIRLSGSVILLAAALAALAACSAEPRVIGPADGSADADGALADGARTDAEGPPVDAAPIADCVLDVDCDDGVFCNGAEHCETGGAARCAAGESPCSLDECVEASDECLPPCADADDDGARVAGCTDARGAGTDCNDVDAAIAPGVADVCNGVDDDCDVLVDEDALSLAVHVDGDGDGFGGAFARMACAAGPDESLVAGDCRDDDPAIHPGADERCNAIDDDCDGLLAAADDADGDGSADVACGGTDCDDSDSAVFPGAPERCNGAIDDCAAGEGPAPDEDRDGDGHASIGATCLSRTACTTSGAVGCESAFDADDCDDVDGAKHPGHAEACDGVDSNCSAGGGLEPTEDADSDGYVALGATCTGGTLAPGDCDDTRADVSPAATEVCNGRDDDCTGLPEAGQPMPNCDQHTVCGGDGYCGTYRNLTFARFSVYAIRYDGRLVAWHGSTRPVGYPTVVDSVPVSVVDVDQNFLSACALGADGSVWCNGSNLNGILGTAVAVGASSDAFVQVRGVSAARELTMGNGTACVTQALSVTCWGSTFTRPSTISRTAWALSSSANLHGTQTDGGMFCAVNASARVVCWGYRPEVIVPGTAESVIARPTVATRSPAGAAAVAFGDSTSPCTLLRADGRVMCWGTPGTTYWPGGFVPDVSGGVSLVLGVGASIAADSSSVSGCTLRTDHTARCYTWFMPATDMFPEGVLEFGQEGYVRRLDGRISQSITPNLSLPIPSVVAPFRIEPGLDGTVVLAVDGSVFYAGRAPKEGTFALGDTASTRVAALISNDTSWTTIAPNGLQIVPRGRGSACYLDRARNTWCVDGNRLTAFTTIPTGAQQLTGGQTHVCGLDAAGVITCGGTNSKGQMGYEPSFGPVLPAQLAEPATSFDAAGDHTCAVGASGAVWCWGVNTSGELGASPTPYTWQPATVPGIDDAIGVASGERHSCALRADTTVWCWGANDTGQLGTVRGADRFTPAQVPGLVDVVAISAGRAHSCALRSDGSVWCWGNNWYGQLGAGTLSGVTGVARVTGLSSPVIDVRVGFDHSCAVTSDGRGWCWGHNEYGKLGDGTILRRSRPVQMWESPR